MGKKNSISFGDFVAYRPMHNYIFLPTREPWPAASINAQLPPVLLTDKNGKPVLDKNGEEKYIKANVWLDEHRPVHQMTWAPGLPMEILDKVVAEGGWVDKPGAICLNLYRPPTLIGKAGKVKPWLDHVRKIYPDDADHIIVWLAHRVQRPADKINHALMLGGAQGIGKDTLLEPVKRAVGPWNFAEVSPTQMLGRFNGYLKSVILRISEARDLGNSNRYDFYDHMKTYTAAPPDTLRVDEKNLREHYIVNVCGVVITSNYKTDGIYLPAEDRRTYVAWSELTKEDFSPKYWKKLWAYYDKRGDQHVAAYLAKLDISTFDAKAPPPKTPAFWVIVDANRAPEEGELADVFDKLKNPDAITLDQVIREAGMDTQDWLKERKNRRIIPHRLEAVGYVPVRNAASDQGLWRIDKIGSRYENGSSTYFIESERQVVYAKNTLSVRDQLAAVEALRRKATEAAKNAIEAAAAKKGANGAQQQQR